MRFIERFFFRFGDVMLGTRRVGDEDGVNGELLRGCGDRRVT